MGPSTYRSERSFRQGEFLRLVQVNTSLEFNLNYSGSEIGVVFPPMCECADLANRIEWNRGNAFMNRKPFTLLYVMLFLVLSSVGISSAQTTTSGGLTGVVTDPSAALVPGAVVEIRDSAKGIIQSAKTDSYGVYRFFFLAPGRYTLAVSHPGFRTESRELNVLLGPPGTVNFALEIAKENTTMKVTGEAPLIQAENGDASATMNQQQVSEVPNPGNDLTYIVQTAPAC